MKRPGPGRTAPPEPRDGPRGASGGRRDRWTVPPQNAYPTVVATLERALIGGERLDGALHAAFAAHPEWPDLTRNAVAETVYDVVRYWRRLRALCGSENLWDVVAAWCRWRGLPGPQTSAAQQTASGPLPQDPGEFAVRESIPAWLDELGERELGRERWRQIVPWLNRRPGLWIRANTIKVTAEELARRLSAYEGAVVERGSLDALSLWIPRTVYTLPEFLQGLFEVQDAASQAVCSLLGAAPGMRVVDGCAGTGGKSLCLAALMRNRGRILALDVDARKLEVLRARVRRAGAEIVEARLVDTTKVVKRRHGSADRLLLDVPCSGLGSLRHNPEIRWRMTPESLERLGEVQREILTRYAPLVRPGGRMLYATCSVLPSEGEEQVAWFLERTRGSAGGWKLESEHRLGPPKEDSDSFYAALLSRGPDSA